MTATTMSVTDYARSFSSLACFYLIGKSRWECQGCERWEGPVHDGDWLTSGGGSAYFGRHVSW